MAQGAHPPRSFDAVVVGAGFAGLYMLHRLRGLGLSARVFEAGSGVGGTWFWNRYPGARCDVESLEYSYQFSDGAPAGVGVDASATRPSRRSSATSSTSPTASTCAATSSSRPACAAAHFDEAAGRWTVETERGSGLGALLHHGDGLPLVDEHAAASPASSRFAGATYHTGRWPHEGVDFTGQRVGVIGTGSSGDPVDPADRRAGGAPLRVPAHARPTRSRRTTARSTPSSVRERQGATTPASAAQNAQLPFGANFPVNERSALAGRRRGARARVRGALAAGRPRLHRGVRRPARSTARPTRRPPSSCATRSARSCATRRSPSRCRRSRSSAASGCASTRGYYETFNRPNVTLVDVSEAPIEEITPDAACARAGATYELDCIVFATGFDAMTGALLAIDIRGSGGRTLREKWAEGPRTYLGLGTAGFPNLFIITGPGSPSVLTNMVPSIEQHVDWIADCIAYLRDQRHRRASRPTPGGRGRVGRPRQRGREPDALSHRATRGTSAPTSRASRACSCRTSASRPTSQKCNEVAAKGYEGFALA